MRKSGPLGIASPVTPKVAAGADDQQATLMFQNDEQLKAVWRLEGTFGEFKSGLTDWMGKLEKRIDSLETFNDRITLIPKSIWALVSVVGIDGAIRIYGMLVGH
jgi:hypothetical protein